MESIDRYNRLNKYLKNLFGERTLKICIDGGFTCPNRDGKKSNDGCLFCSEKGSGEHINSLTDISKQVQNYFKSYKAERANKFIVYFQNFTNTYAPIEILKQKYDSALIDDRIVGLEIATRPDCINEDVAKLLHSYTNKYYVCVELGLQTSNNETGNFLNRGYTSEDFSNAVKILNNYNINVVAHIMIGLPGETKKDLENTVNFINKHNIQGIKIHSTYVIENTGLNELYKNDNYKPLELDEYIENLAYVLTHISKDVIIHRLSGDAPKDLLVAPQWNSHKKLILNGIDKYMKTYNLYQGMYYN